MKGPGLRLKGDVRRVWRCPTCGTERPSVGAVTSLRCRCEKPGPWMRLVEPRRFTRPDNKPVDVYFECDADVDPGVESHADSAALSEPPVELVSPPEAEIPDEHESATTPAASVDSVTADPQQPEPVTDTPQPPPAEPNPDTASEHPSQKRKRKPGRGRRRRGRRRGGGKGPQADSSGAGSS